MSDQNNNNNDIENDFDEYDDGGFDDFGGKKGTLGDLWRNNPFVKIGIILAAFVFVVAGIILFGGRGEQPTPSRVTSPSDVTEAPGTSEISDAYREAIEETNEVQTEQAIRDNSSVVPMPTSPPIGVLPQQLDGEEVEDPLDRWRRMQEERIAQQQLVAPEPAPVQPQVDNRTPVVNALSEAMANQMETVLSVQQIKGATKKDITSMAYLEALEAKRLQKAQMEAQSAAYQQGLDRAATDIAEILVPAGTIEYAQLVTEANTDAPGPVMAQIQSGPLKGARVLGSFQATEEYLTLNFNMVVLDGVSQQVTAVALDPGTTLPGMATDIDRRYFKRIVLPAAAAFVEGLAEAIANSESTTVTIIGDSVSQTTSTGDQGSDESVASGIEEAGATLSQIIGEEASRTRPMLKIRAGTAIGVLFLTPVLEEPIPTQNVILGQQQANMYGFNQQPFFSPSVNPYAQQTAQPVYPYATPVGNTGLPTNQNANFFGNAGYFNPIGNQ